MKVYIFRGFGGELFSTGMDRLAEKIKEAFPDNEVTIDAYDKWFKYYSDIKISDEKVVLIGHSFGALSCYKIASMLPQTKFPLVISFDYSPYYSGLIGHMPDGIVPDNVDWAVNFYQDVDPLIRGVHMQRSDGSERNISNFLTEYAHVEIDKVPDLHQEVLHYIRNVDG